MGDEKELSAGELEQLRVLVDGMMKLLREIYEQDGIMTFRQQALCRRLLKVAGEKL